MLGVIPAKKILKYYGAGLLANVVAYAVFVLFVYIRLGDVYSMTIAFVVGHVLSFYMNRKHVFKSQKPLARSFVLTVSAIVFAYVLNVLAIYVMCDLYGFSSYYVQALTVILISVLLYLINSIFIHS